MSLSDERFQELLDDGTIHPNMGRNDMAVPCTPLLRLCRHSGSLAAKLVVSKVRRRRDSGILPHRRPWHIGHACRVTPHERRLRLAKACGMLRSSGWGMLERGGILQFCLAA